MIYSYLKTMQFSARPVFHGELVLDSINIVISGIR